MSEYNGSERRRNWHNCLHENDWGALKATVENLDKRINGSLEAITKHMDDGDGWRKAIVGIVFCIFIQIGTFAYLWGGVTKQVEINTGILKHQENIIEEIRGKTYGFVIDRSKVVEGQRRGTAL